MYTVIEEIEVNPSPQNMASQINSQSSRPDYSQSFRKKYYEDPSENYPSQPGSIKMWSQDPQDMYYSEPVRQRARYQDPSMHEFQNYMSKALNRTSVKSLMNKAQDSDLIQSSPQPEPEQQQTPPVITVTTPVDETDTVTNKELKDMIEHLKDLIKNHTEHAREREKRMKHKLKMIEMLLKALMFIVLLFLFVLIFRK